MQHMPAQELVEWAAFYELEPFGEWRADWRMAMQASLLANIHRDRDKHPELYTVADFMPQFGVEDTPKTPEDMLATVVALNALFGGQDLRTPP
jgi:hypothetical protein